MIADRALLGVHALLCAWFGLNFAGVPRWVSREGLVGVAGALLGAVVTAGIAYVLGWQAAALPMLPTLLYWCWIQRRHWIFYFLGAPPAMVETYDQLFGKNVRILPIKPGGVVPDAYHTILHVLLVAELGLTIRACVRLAG